MSSNDRKNLQFLMNFTSDSGLGRSRPQSLSPRHPETEIRPIPNLVESETRPRSLVYGLETETRLKYYNTSIYECCRGTMVGYPKSISQRISPLFHLYPCPVHDLRGEAVKQ